MTEETKANETNGTAGESFKTFAERMMNDREFRSDTLMMTVSLIIRNIGAIERRLDLLEKAVAAAAAVPGTEPETGESAHDTV
jgi:hypothetical protein